MLTPQQAQRLAREVFAASDEDPAAAAAPTFAEPLPERIGEYRVVRRLASGGMGQVFEAVQDHPHRTVAVKVLRPGLVSRQMLRRFHVEADILGQLQHPNIAQVFAAGSHDDGAGGVPYFAMEFVPDAQPVTVFASAKRLPIRPQLELFAQVCDAVHYGHQRGFIHRDLKPANILVGAPQDGADARLPVVKVIDFGIARSTNADIALTTMQTDVNQIIGTLQYMSPEQCDGDPRNIDIRTDVYSLGVVLYELLCERLPYDVSNKSIGTATRIVQETEPPHPSTILKSLRGDLEAIVLKAMEKDPARRYQTAGELGADIRSHLRGETVTARLPSRWTRSIKWVTQHPIVTTAAACVGIVSLSVSLTLGTVWFVNRRPYDISLSADHSDAWLVSISGRRLHTWSAGAAKGIVNCDYIHSHDGQTPDLALIAFAAKVQNSRPGQVCAFVAEGDRTNPAWVAQIVADDMPEDFRDYGIDFTARIEAVGDVLPNVPGVEVVVAFIHNGSSGCALCIYSVQDGNLLYRVWHDGSFSQTYWMLERGLLIVMGRNSEVLAKDRGYPVVSNQVDHPEVIFALKPVAGHISTRWTTPTGTPANGGKGEDTTLEWYHAFPGRDMFEHFGLHNLSIPHSGNDAGKFVHVTLYLRAKPEYHATFLFDADGVIQDRRASDSWRNDPNPPLSADSVKHVKTFPLPPRVGG